MNVAGGQSSPGHAVNIATSGKPWPSKHIAYSILPSFQASWMWQGQEKLAISLTDVAQRKSWYAENGFHYSGKYTSPRCDDFGHKLYRTKVSGFFYPETKQMTETTLEYLTKRKEMFKRVKIIALWWSGWAISQRWLKGNWCRYMNFQLVR